MKSKLFMQALVFSIIIAAVGAVLLHLSSKNVPESTRSDDIVAVSEIKTLLDSGNTDTAKARLGEYEDKLRNTKDESKSDQGVLWICIAAVAMLFANACYTYLSVLRP